MKKVIITLFILIGLSLGSVFGQDTVMVSGTTGTTTWTKDKVFLLDGYVRVDNGEVLTIEPGTVVLAESGSQEDASALIVERDGIILAEGTEVEPIIFTSVLDDTSDPFDFLDDQSKGLWGGLIICGDAPTNTNENGTEQVEGIPTDLPATVGTFGGNVADDSSGVLKYVSIRHTGVALASNNEIQGLTLAGVGSKTVIDYVESYASDDDGIEIFGGTVNLKHIVVAFASDDMFDLDQGWTGNVQWLFVLQSADFGDRLGEWDGADTPEDGLPYGAPTIYNMTMIGSNPAATNNRTISFRANGGGKVYNSIFYEQGRGIDIEIKSDANVPESSYDRFVAGDLVVSNNVFWNVAGNTASDLYTVSPIAGGWTDSSATVSAAVTDVLNTMSAANVIADPVIAGLSYIADGQLDPRFSGSDVSTDLATVPNSWFTPTHYKGAFPPNKGSFWAANWTALDHYGYFNKDLTTGINDIVPLEGVKVYPNPNNGIFSVNASNLNAEAVNISVFDMTGRTISAQVVMPVAGQVQTELNIESAPAGMYLVKVQQGTSLSTSQIVKN